MGENLGDSVPGEQACGGGERGGLHVPRSGLGRKVTGQSLGEGVERRGPSCFRVPSPIKNNLQGKGRQR